MQEPLIKQKIDSLTVTVHEDAQAMGKYAADAIARDMKRIAQDKGNLRIMFAAAPSQNTTLEALLAIPDLPWDKVTAFHMDEYVGIDEKNPASFRNYLNRTLFTKAPFYQIHYIKGEGNIEEEIARYEALLHMRSLDLVLMGIGENGHIAFNDPPDASFQDPHYVKLVRLSEKSRMQQIHDGCFTYLEQVPTHAVTVTIPAFLDTSILHCMVPYSLKADAVKTTLFGEITEECPASILRKHPKAQLYLDQLSGLSLM